MLLLQLLQLLPAVAGVAQLDELPAASSRAPNCTFVADIDYNGGDVAKYQLLPPPDATREARCCDLCDRTPNCHAGILTGASHSPPHACWLKGDKGSLKSNADVMSCWKPGVPVPPPGWACNASDWTCSKVPVGGKPTQAACSAGCKAPPPPPPQCYRAKVTQFDEQPVISAVGGSSTFQQAFNPSWIVSSAGTGGKAGLIIRTQNCSATVGGSCVACAGTGPKASVLTFSELLNDDNSSEITPKFKPINSHSLVFGPHDDSDLRGTEDPRVAFDAATGIYYMFYTCWAKDGTGSLCLASTKNPTDTSAGIAGSGWTRHGPAFPGNHKSGALLIREKPPHYLISGAGKIFIAKSDSLLNWTLGDPFISSTLWGNPNVEAGPPPMRLSDGNYVFFHNSWGGKGVPPPGYQPAWVVLDGNDPSKILARAPKSLWTPTDQPWMEGKAPWTCNVRQVAFLEAAHPAGGDSFRVYFGGADTVVGTALVQFEKVAGMACEN